MRAWAAWLALFACSSALGSPELDVIAAIEQQGGQVHFTIGKTCSSCERGALASHAFASGEVIARLPAGSTLAVGPGSLSEEAIKLLTRIHTEPEVNQTFAAFLSSMPGLDDMLAPSSLAPADLSALQMPEFERLVAEQQREVAAAFSKQAQVPPWLTLQQLHHMTALLRTRSFGSLLGSRRLVPAIDMLNHGEEPNTAIDDAGGKAVLLKAVRPIAQGEELFVRYKTGILHRDDASLFLYGFIPQEQSLPLLCALDLPTYTAALPWRSTDANDERYVPSVAGGWLPDLQLLTEYGRLAGLLSSQPTTEQQDEQLLAASGQLPSSWKLTEMVRFRLRRKRALRHALELMEAAWSAAHPAAGSLRALCGPGSGGQQQAGGTSAGRCSGGAARLAAKLNPGNAVATVPEFLLEPLGAVVLAALQLRRPDVLGGRPDVLMLVACGAALLFMTRKGGR